MKIKIHWMLIPLLPIAAPAHGQDPAPRRIPAFSAASGQALPLNEQKVRSRGPWIVVSTLGGTMVGAWLGYMTSQVRYSDWDRDKLHELGDKRRRFTAYGAGIGSLVGLGFSFQTGSRPSRGTPMAVPPKPGAHLITRQEIGEAGVATAYDVVQTLRRNWLHERGTHSMRETTVAEVGGTSLQDTQIRVTRVGDPTIIAYLNEAFLGPVDRLREIPAVTVHSIRYYDPAAATQRWGAGHTHGAIQVLTQEQLTP